MDINHTTIYGPKAKNGLFGKSAQVTTRRRNIEDHFGSASLTGREASADGKLNFFWAIDLDRSLTVYIWDYKYYGDTDMYSTKTWSIGGKPLAIKALAEITGWEIS